jgi:hypothetical protein
MAIELDPLYQTETMVKIYREQGSSLHAMELAEIILEKDPGNDSVRGILNELKEEARISFERFRQAGRTEPPEEPPAAILTFQGAAPVSPKQRKIDLLQSFLAKVQNHRQKNG